MKPLQPLAVVLSLVALVAWTEPLSAQISIGGFNSNNNQSNRDEENKNQSSNGTGSRRSINKSNKPSNPSNHQGGHQGDDDNSNEIQQFIPGFPGSQNSNRGNQNNSGQMQRSRQAGPYPGAGNNNPQVLGWPNNNNSGQNNITIGTWQGGKWNGSRNVNNWTKVYGGESQPFSQQWYQSHPKAWKYNNNNNNTDVWIAASIPGVYSWLGWGSVPQQYNVNQGRIERFDPSHYGDWYPLGVFSLMSGPGDSGTRMVQLAVDRHGHIAGNYYDMITGSNYSVSGDISRQSQRVSWALNKNKFIRFRAHIGQLLQPYGTISVRLPGGEQQWQFVRLEN